MKRVGYIDFIRIFEENLNTCIYGRFSNSYLSGNNLSGALTDEKADTEKARSEKSGEKNGSCRCFPEGRGSGGRSADDSAANKTEKAGGTFREAGKTASKRRKTGLRTGGDAGRRPFGICFPHAVGRA